MQITGDATLRAPAERVWAALTNPGVLVRTIPGCDRLDPIGPDSYRFRVALGLASVRGSYTGEVQLADQRPPSALVMRVSGAGRTGTFHAAVRIGLDDCRDGCTQVRYTADAAVPAVVGAVAQRMLAGVAKKLASDFLGAVDDLLAGPGAAGQRRDCFAALARGGAIAAMIALAAVPIAVALRRKR